MPSVKQTLLLDSEGVLKFVAKKIPQRFFFTLSGSKGSFIRYRKLNSLKKTFVLEQIKEPP